MTDRLCNFIFPFAIGSEAFTNMVLSENRVFIKRNYYIHNPEWNEYFFSRLHLKRARGYEDPTQRVIVAEYIEEQSIDKWPLIYVNNNVQAYSNAVLILWNK